MKQATLSFFGIHHTKPEGSKRSLQNKPAPVKVPQMDEPAQMPPKSQPQHKQTRSKYTFQPGWRGKYPWLRKLSFLRKPKPKHLAFTVSQTAHPPMPFQQSVVQVRKIAQYDVVHDRGTITARTAPQSYALTEAPLPNIHKSFSREFLYPLHLLCGVCAWLDVYTCRCVHVCVCACVCVCVISMCVCCACACCVRVCVCVCDFRSPLAGTTRLRPRRRSSPPSCSPSNRTTCPCSD